MRLNKVRIKNFKSIKDSGDIEFQDNMFVLAGQNESGKSSILEAMELFGTEKADRSNLNFELESKEDYIQEVICEFTDMDDEFHLSLSDLLSRNLDKVFSSNEVIIDSLGIDSDILKKIKTISIIKKFDLSEPKSPSSTTVNQQVYDLILLSIKVNIRDMKNESSLKEIKVSQKNLSLETFKQFIDDELSDMVPKIKLFNDFSDLLPDKILLSQIKNKSAKGYQAVNNLEKMLNNKFEKIASKKTPQKNSAAENESKYLSLKFQEDWQQKIFETNSVNIRFFIENDNSGQKEISFYIETKDSELLEPRKRSKGMIWFLSLWFELKAREKEKKLVFLFDEPGLHLHVKANKDMLTVFHKLAKQGHQIIYSTHSPSLIETDNLNNIGLVLNDKEKGTLVEKLTTSKINTKNKKDALQPIAQAMGLDLGCDFSILHEKNVLVEGLSDFWYFKGMKKLLELDNNYEFVPGIGISTNKIYNLISFCIGYGLDWLLVMDGGVTPKKTFIDLQNNLFNGDEESTKTKIKMLTGEIEDMFDLDDLKHIDSEITINKSRSSFENIGKKRKILFAKLFYQKVDTNEIKLNDLNSKTIKRFKEVFDWIDEKFNMDSKTEEK